MEPISEQALALEFAGLQLDHGRPLTQQLHARLKQLLLAGGLRPGAQMPTTRALAQQLGVSRNTVVHAYERLHDEGFLLARVGAGSYVAGLPAAHSVAKDDAATPPARPDTAIWQQMQALHLPRVHGPEAQAFRYGLPVIDQFPTAIWARLQARFWRQSARHQLGYSDPAGLPRLRAQIAAYLSHARGLHCEPEQVIITSGAQQAISLAALALLKPGDRVAMESPGYRAAAAALALPNTQVLRVPVDGEGLRIAALQALGPARLCYVTPSHQFPTGVTMSLARRLALLDWARQQNAFILEDDYDGEFRFSGAPLAPLASLDRHGRTLYLGSFSKLLLPGLRLGYLVVPGGWAEGMAKLRGMLDRHAPIADQTVLADFIEQGHFLRHLRRVRRAAHARRDALLKAWQQRFGERLPLAEVSAGLHALLPLRHAEQENRLAQLARQHRVEVGRLREIGEVPSCSGRAGLVLGFAPSTPAQISAAVDQLAQAWQTALD
ncbi:PLP-dependent aminotransferase family protein [Paucibacter sp. APW11]|uniref:PLP-dependent aminotransferase family protein n=1 Tax=Roseateles aquae TaxID=3077235 RepID=A0ABU3P980_9BURK|nr:PLP-dependent aminotransferase family protein [Paucibacter sp. APW11]MDT8999130.1 PLP-dependent aminotransferase family protein [Paucibacter sp. APW11]